MKMNKKIIVSTLALAMGAALAGSVSGTVAWFQYSTRAQASYIGATAHCTEALEIQATAINGTPAANNWKTELSYSDIDTARATTGTNIIPITSGALTSESALPTNFYKNPIYQYSDMAKWGTADSTNYVQFELHFHVLDIKGGNATAYLAKTLYLKDLSIVSLTDSNGLDESLDLADAVRVHVSDGTNNKLFANVESTTTNGSLDLNNDGAADTTTGYEWETGTGTAITYGAGTQSSIDVTSASLAVDTDPYNIVANSGEIGDITAADDGLTLTVTIWLEGWQALTDAAKNDTKVWDPDTYIGKKFGVGFKFVVEAHQADE